MLVFYSSPLGSLTIISLKEAVPFGTASITFSILVISFICMLSYSVTINYLYKTGYFFNFNPAENAFPANSPSA